MTTRCYLFVFKKRKRSLIKDQSSSSSSSSSALPQKRLKTKHNASSSSRSNKDEVRIEKVSMMIFWKFAFWNFVRVLKLFILSTINTVQLKFYWNNMQLTCVCFVSCANELCVCVCVCVCVQNGHQTLKTSLCVYAVLAGSYASTWRSVWKTGSAWRSSSSTRNSAFRNACCCCHHNSSFLKKVRDNKNVPLLN